MALLTERWRSYLIPYKHLAPPEQNLFHVKGDAQLLFHVPFNF